MKKRWILTVCAIGALIMVGGAYELARYADSPIDPDETPARDIAVTPELVARGAYLARAANCRGCHTVEGGTPFAGGVPMKTPLGTIYTTNITPDKRYGIGSYSDADFLAAMYRGIAPRGRHLYPAFPYSSFTKMSVEDVLAIKAYLFSLDAVSRPAPETDLGFPFNQRWGIAFWNLLYNPKQRFTADPSLSDSANRGKYLVEGLGHCGGCHSPRTLLYGESERRALAGGVAEGMRAYNITSDRRFGIGAWSHSDIVNYLDKGLAAGRGVAGGSMGQIVRDSTSHLSDRDLAAIADYLLQTPPAEEGVGIADAPPATRDQALLSMDVEPRGRMVYAGACAGCHGWGGSTVASPLVGLKTVNDPDGLNTMAVILRGIDLNLHTSDNIQMPAFADGLNDVEIAAVTRFIGAAFGTGPIDVSPDDVAKQRHHGSD